MFNLFDLMRAAQGGAAMENMSRQFGLSVDQTRRATEALMPAFALGFQRNAADPMGFSNLLRMMGSGQYASFYQQPALAFTPKAWSEGNQILGQLFGQDASRQVAEQTAAWAGVAPDVMKQMMPSVATMLMGGLSQSAANQGLAEMFEQFAKMLRGGAPAARPGVRGRANEPATMGDPFSAWANMFGAMWGGAAPAPDKPEPKRAKPDEAADPFAAWTNMMTAMMGGGKETAPAPVEPPPPPERPPLQSPVEFFGQMFETGREVQQQQLATLQNIIDGYWGGGSKRP